MKQTFSSFFLSHFNPTHRVADKKNFTPEEPSTSCKVVSINIRQIAIADKNPRISLEAILAGLFLLQLIRDPRLPNPMPGQRLQASSITRSMKDNRYYKAWKRKAMMKNVKPL